MPTETEIERLVVRLTGDGSPYQKMVEQAEAGNKRLMKSIDENTVAQKKATEAQQVQIDKMKEADKGILSLIASNSLFGKGLEIQKKMIEGTTEAVKSLTTAVSTLGKTLKDEVVATLSAKYDELDPRKGFFAKLKDTFSTETYNKGIKDWFAQKRANMKTVIDETVEQGDGFWFTGRATTQRQADFEAFQKQDRDTRGARLAAQQRSHELSVARDERGRIHDPVERIQSIRNALKVAREEQQQLYSEANNLGPSGGKEGARAKLERLEGIGGWEKFKQTVSDTISGTDSYKKKVAEAREEWEKVVEREKEAAAVVRDIEREEEAAIRARKHALEDMMYQSRTGVQRIGETSNEKTIREAQEQGASPEQTAELLYNKGKMEEAEQNEKVKKTVQELSDSLDEEIKKLDKSRDRWDAYAEALKDATDAQREMIKEKLHNLEMDEDQARMDAQRERDRQEYDKWENEQIYRIEREQQAEDRHWEKERERDRQRMDDDRNRAIYRMQDKASHLRQNLKTPEQRRDDERKEVEDLYKNNFITLDEYHKALKKIADEAEKAKKHVRELAAEPAALAGSLEALMRYEEFQNSLHHEGETVTTGSVKKWKRKGPTRRRQVVKGADQNMGIAGGGGPDEAANADPANDNLMKGIADDIKAMRQANDQMLDNERNAPMLRAAGFAG